MKKKLYNQPIVELMQLMPGTIVLAGSPPLGNVNMGGGGGSSLDPD